MTHILYTKLANVAEDLRRTIARFEGYPAHDRLALDALWVRLDDLVDQLPEALHAEQEREEP